MQTRVPIDYRPNEDYCRKKDGCVIPTSSSDVLVRLYGEKMRKFGGVVMSPCRCYFVNEHKTAIMPARVLSELGRAGTPVQRLTSYLTIPNAQVKNFLNACRACVGLTGAVRIAVVGSKAHEGGGIWHKYFALFLAQFCTTIVIDFYDFSEIDSEWNMSYRGVNISCEWIAEPVTPEKLAMMQYDCIVDDVWTYESGASIGAVNSKYFSLKGRPDSIGYEPFLHSSETRKFSHPPSGSQLPGCDCMVCSVCKQVSYDYEQYLYVRSFCARLGLATPCLGVGYVGELVKLNDIHLKLLQNPQFSVPGPSVWRFVMALSEEMPIDAELTKVWRTEKDPKFLPVRRFRELNLSLVKKSPLNSVDWLADRAVTFSGVHPSVLGATKIRQGLDVLIASGIDVFMVNTGYKYVCVPVETLPSGMALTWKATGRKFGDPSFYEYVWVPPDPPRTLVPVAVQQFHRGSVYPKLGVFPVSDTSVHMFPLLRKESSPGGQPILYSFGLKEGKAVMSEFVPRKWRQSIWVYEDTWGHISPRQFTMFPSDWLARGSIPLPWDLTPDEVLKFDNVESQAFIRECVKRQTELTQQDMSRKFNGKSLMYCLNVQEEALVIRSGKKFRLDLTPQAIWAGTQLECLRSDFLLAKQRGSPALFGSKLAEYCSGHMK